MQLGGGTSLFYLSQYAIPFCTLSLVFFVGKKDRSKRIVIDYYGLNKQTVKNNYLLLLITDLIDSIGSKKIFTKIDL